MGYEAAITGFLAVFALIAIRVPVGVALGIVGVGGYAVLVGLKPALSLLTLTPLRTASDINFAVVPLFIVMGILARNSGISAELFAAFRTWFSSVRGGLGLATIGSCAGFSAVCGSSVATAATMAKIAIPEMIKSGYQPRLAAGAVAAGGTLGILIPPSVPLMIYGIISETDIGMLFMAGFLPGILATALYMLVIRLIAWRHPEAVPMGSPSSWAERIASLSGLWSAMIIFTVVIGGIYGGLFTVVEAAGVGAAATLFTAVLQRRLNFRGVMDSFAEAVRTTGALFTMLIGAMLFSTFLTITQAPQSLVGWLGGLDMPPYAILLMLMLMYFVLGWFLDAIAMILITVPVVFPVIVGLGFDPIWFGVLLVIACEMGMLTPPYGINVFVINAVIPSISIPQIFRGVLPFIAIDILRLALIILFPWIALVVPQMMR
ncbi:TRAP transporter large permease [Oceanibium sediminis]|uniref:TRAP transporter large permease n=1 Tax=Oceanibium sediminis TaxID=2026339 RepID=UPI000DD2D449|nr:TRAP transporter large permease [Oceanibium sediminis]